MMFSPQALNQHLPPYDGQPLWLGFSGGLDSTVLLHALVQLGRAVKAVHINHQISPNALLWEAQCAQLCAALGVEFRARRVTVINQGRGIEDAARAERYKIFSTCLDAGGTLLTAHHADDQAETLLLRLLRGTGPRGLAAMARQRPLGRGQIWRPLLNFTRAQLEAYAKANQLHWVEDESNRDDHYDRNFLRNQVMPLLQARWPGFQARWQQTAELCASNEQLLDQQAAQDLALAEFRPERLGTSISKAYWLSVPQARQQLLLRFWLRTQGLAAPEQQHWRQIHVQLTAAADAEVCLRFGDLTLRVYRDRIYLVPLLDVKAFPNTCELQAEATELRLGRLLLQPALPGSTRPQLKAGLSHLQIRYRQGGERAHPARRLHSQTLKKLLQEYGLEPWLREFVPLIYSGEQLAAVGDLWVCHGFEAVDSAGMEITWQL